MCIVILLGHVPDLAAKLVLSASVSLSQQDLCGLLGFLFALATRKPWTIYKRMSMTVCQ